MNRRHFLFSLLALCFWVSHEPAARSATYTFNKTETIVFAGTGADRRSSVYPSTLAVSGIPVGTVTSVKLTLKGLTVLRPDDMEMVLVSPSGAKLVFWADNGSATTAITNLDITLDDAAATVLPDGAGLAHLGSYRPSCVDSISSIATDFPGVSVSSPGDCATPRGSATFTTQFCGAFTSSSAKDPNGTWSLYTVDDVAGTDSIDGGTSRFTGWTLTLTADVTTVGTTTTLQSSQASSTTGGSVTFTATVTKQSDLSAVTSGTVTFREGATTLASGVALNGAGQASYTTSALSEGDHTITADYSPGSGFLASTASVVQRVDNATSRSGNTFSNTGTISIPSLGSGTAAAYPSRITVSGLSGTISKVTLTLTGITLGKLDDLEGLLVDSAGRTFAFLGDAGGTSSGLSGVTLTFDDGAASAVSDTVAPSSGTYRPTSYDSADDSGSAPSGSSSLPPPSGPYSRAGTQGSGTFANVFAGATPNGSWSLYLYDDVVGDGATTISGGWSLTFTTTGDAATATSVASSANPALLGAPVTFTATVTTSPGGVPVTSGTVTFREGATALGASVALNGSGQATLTTSSLVEGNHLINVDYNGSPGAYNLSTSSTLDQRIDGPTTASDVTATGGRFCNTAAITVSASSPNNAASVYPSHINVTSLSGSVTGLQVDLLGATVSVPDALELLLVGPNGNNLVLVSDVGGTASAVSGVNLVLSDTTASFIPDTGPMTAGTWKPSSANTGSSNFPTPAPSAGSLVHPGTRGSATLLSQFGNSAATGAWSLYAMNDLGDSASLTGGWCLTFTINAPPVATADTIARDKDRSVKVPIATLLSNDTDPNGTTPTFVSVGSPSANGAAVHVVGSWISYEAIPGNNGSDSFSYTISDGTTTAAGTVTVNVERPELQTLNLNIASVPGTATLSLRGIPGRTYQFQYTTSLSSPIAWSALGPPVSTDSAGRAQAVDTSGETRFYRAIEP